MATEKIRARVTKRGHARAEGGELVRYRKGDIIMVTARELASFSNVLAAEPASDSGKTGQDAGTPAAGTGTEGAGAPALRTNGPTMAEWLAAGYKAEGYPPHGYAAREGAPTAAETDRLADDGGAAADAADLEIETRKKRVAEAPDVQALRIIADEFAVKVNKSWGVDRTREFLMLELSHSDGG